MSDILMNIAIGLLCLIGTLGAVSLLLLLINKFYIVAIVAAVLGGAWVIGAMVMDG